MPRAIPAAISVEVVRKWLSLAQQRKAHLIELYEGRRWRLYYTDAEFIDRLREAIRGVDRWSATEQAVTTLTSTPNAKPARGRVVFGKANGDARSRTALWQSIARRMGPSVLGTLLTCLMRS